MRRRERRITTRAQREQDQEQALMGLRQDINTGAYALTQDDLLGRERPDGGDDDKPKPPTFKRARVWERDNWFVGTVNELRASFFNYGLRFLPRQRTAKTVTALRDYLDVPEQREELEDFVAAAWAEWLLQRNVVSFWRDRGGTRPTVVPVEDCRYSEAMGVKKLWVRLDYKPEDLRGGGLSQELVARYSQREIQLSEDWDEYFAVLKATPRGQGFGYPALYRVFRTCSQSESMEVGESMYAFAGRLVLRFHKLGFEVKSAANAMKQSDYLWKKTRSDAIQKFFQGRQGFAEYSGQFDHNIGYVWTDPKLYDARKWETVINRLLWWGGPVGFMLMSKTPSPFLLPLLETQAHAERRKLQPWLERVINEGFGLKTPIRLAWGNRCFKDPRLAWDMTKALMTQGPLSLKTAVEDAGHDPDLEAETKRDEARADRREELIPLWDPSHGNKPGEGSPGRPATKSAAARKDGGGA